MAKEKGKETRITGPADDKLDTLKDDVKSIEPITVGHPAEETLPKKEEVTEEKPKEETVVTEEKKVEEPPPSEEEKPSKYKTIEEAIAANQEAQRKITELAEENKRLKEPKVVLKPEPPKVDPVDEITERTAKLIETFDADDPEYAKKVNRAWATAQKDIARLTYTELTDADKTYNEQVTYINSKIKDAKMDEYQELFWKLMPSIPGNLTVDDAIKFGLDLINGTVNKAVEAENKRKAEIDKNRQNTTVLTKGGTPIPRKAEEDSKPTSLKDDLRFVQSQRPRVGG